MKVGEIFSVLFQNSRQVRPGLHAFAQKVMAAMAVSTGIALLRWMGLAYLQPELRKAIVFSGFGLC